ncbi:hypothetical protein EWM62_10310 [Mucilaginibacter terrigena]|uniref:DUF2281 domain-containing protein n=1 Tax=Mucilaginibacter terrigena TaxID=2492395 RepID=A0A4Q5LLV1_9SPHI|nr:hypothetical protein [Mucilaginibacter terrigena]RYU89932.1 hypothetical protein EWM62_10310 [Mucilaginibacter terrigena]
MKTAEIKEKITKIIDQLPEDKLPEALALITEFSETAAQDKRRKLVEQIIKEDYELLKKLSD